MFLLLTIISPLRLRTIDLTNFNKALYLMANFTAITMPLL